MSFFTGTPGSYSQLSRLGPEQKSLYAELLNASRQRGAGGAFGTAADYYRDLLSDDNSTYNAFMAPDLRRFREQTIPDIAEQYAGMGAGNLSSSSFRNAAVNAGTDLSERLGAIRAQLRQQAAQGLTGIGQLGLQDYNENIYNQGQPGLVDSIGPALGAVGSIFGSPILGAAGSFLANKWFKPSDQVAKGSSSPYGKSNVGGM
jgi:hypothetical protein